jgi:hypothetical protein
MASLRGLLVLCVAISATTLMGVHAQEEGGRIPQLCQVVSASEKGRMVDGGASHRRPAVACAPPLTRSAWLSASSWYKRRRRRQMCPRLLPRS